jgi:hypothetical protein
MRTKPIPRQKTGPNGEKLCRWCETPVPKGRRTFCGNDCVHEAMLRSDPGYLRAQTKKRDKGICSACGTDTEAMKLQYLKIATVARQGIDGYEKLKKAALDRLGATKDRLWQIFNNPCREATLQQNEAEMARAIRYHEEMVERFKAEGREFPRPHPETALAPYLARRLAGTVEFTPEERRLIKIHTRLRNLAEARRKRIAAELEATGFKGSASKQKLTNLWQADHIHPVAEGGGGCGLENIQTLCSRCHKRKTAEQASRAALIRRGIDPDAPPAPEPQATFDL